MWNSFCWDMGQCWDVAERMSSYCSISFCCMCASGLLRNFILFYTLGLLWNFFCCALVGCCGISFCCAPLVCCGIIFCCALVGGFAISFCCVALVCCAIAFCCALLTTTEFLFVAALLGCYYGSSFLSLGLLRNFFLLCTLGLSLLQNLFVWWKRSVGFGEWPDWAPIHIHFFCVLLYVLFLHLGTIHTGGVILQTDFTTSLSH